MLQDYWAAKISSANMTPDGERELSSEDGRRASSAGIGRQYTLVSVSLKEAATDSPTFRASINHLDDQIDNIEQWLQALVSSCRKVPKLLNEVQSFYNSFMDHLLPSFLQDGLVDQEYTYQSLTTSLAGLKRLWGFSINALDVHAIDIENLNTGVVSKIKHYREMRKIYGRSRVKYEKFLKMYAAASKTRDPASILEDANQLFIARKEYLHHSLDLIVEFATLGSTLDNLLVKASSSLWKFKKMSTSEFQDPYFEEAYVKILKIQAWSDSYSVAMNKLQSEMIAARNQIEKSTLENAKPCSDLNEYKSSIINAHYLSDIDEYSFEKHGYLFMKTSTPSGKPAWVRRWVFIKDGVFGMLVLSPSKTSVQETDKFGVLLSNVKYFPNEDRKFCFQVKTNDFAIILQAETIIELKSWLKVFENEQTRIARSAKVDRELFNIASGRYPPILTEFASTVNTTVDRELTSSRTINSLGQVIVSSNLCLHIENNRKDFQNNVYYQIPLVRPPIMTGSTKTSIIAYVLTAPTTIPTALTANIWGSVNWGVYCLQEVADRTGAVVDDFESDSPYLNNDNLEPGVHYPDNYPESLISLDIQMRAIFETAVDPHEHCLISFRCIWSPNQKQELSGRCFITRKHVYFYMLALGFVALYKEPVNRLVSVECQKQSKYDLLKIYTVNGMVNLKLFLDDGELAKRKMMCLVENVASENPKSTVDLIADLNKIDADVAVENEDIIKLQIIHNLCKKVNQKEKVVRLLNDFGAATNMPESSLSMDVAKTTGVQFDTDFKKEYQYCSTGTFNMPPRAIYHALLGDNANILKDYTSFAEFPSLIKEPWRKAPDGSLFRSFNTAGVSFNNKCEVQVHHIVDNIYPDEYYTFTQKELEFKLCLGSSFSVDYKFVILGVAGKSKVYLYARRTFKEKLICNGFVNWFCHIISFAKGSTFISQLSAIEKELGEHGTIAKAVYFYGKLSVTDLEQKLEPVPTNYFSLLDVIKVIVLSIKNFIVYYVLKTLRLIVNGSSLFVRNLRMNYLLVIFCLTSMLVNLFLVGRSSISYWNVRDSREIAYQYINDTPILMQRAVYSKDVNELITEKAGGDNSGNSQCFNKFKNQSFVLNYQQQTHWNEVYGDETTKSMAKRLRQNLWEIGIKRHDLIVQLKSLTHMETELSEAEWRNWLVNEVHRCLFVQSTVIEQLSNESVKSTEIGNGVSAILDYCQDCNKQLFNVDIL